ncbi:MAG TPA: cupin domain-containing protein [Desulfobacteraceae bacterium]|nr:cupin domain-containing protein [Desulfobacteraceae bacterium]
MTKNKYIFTLSDAKEKVTHGGAGLFRIILDEETCGAKNLSFLVNTMKAGLNCNTTGSGHSHEEEHCMYILDGAGGIYIDGEKYTLEPNLTVYVPPWAMPYVWADPMEDLTDTVLYSPPGPEKNL